MNLDTQSVTTEYTARDLLSLFRVDGAKIRAELQAGILAVMDELAMIEGKKQFRLQDIYKFRMIADRAAP